jgi:hypothetical protein
MLLPISLQQAIEIARRKVQLHPQHALLPLERLKLYAALGSENSPQYHQVRAILALLTTQKVLPLWEEARGYDRFPHSLLELAERVLYREMDVELAITKGNQGFELLEKLGAGVTTESRDVYFHVEEAVFWVGEAAVAALFEVTGIYDFDACDIAEDDTDADIDPWSTDTAGVAAAAYAGGVWEENSSSTLRREFWNWWLHQAIPESWLIGTGHKAYHREFS